MVRVNHNTGKPATPGDNVVIWEALKPEVAKRDTKQKIIGNESGVSNIDNKEENQTSEITYENDSDDEIQLGAEY